MSQKFRPGRLLRSFLASVPRCRTSRSALRTATLELLQLEARDVPAIPLYFNAPADVVGAGVYVAVTGKDPASTPVDQGLYFQFAGNPVNGVYSGSYVDLSASTPSIPLQKLEFQHGNPPAGDTVPQGYSWVQVNLPDSLVDSGQIIMFVGKNSPTTLPVVSSTGSGGTFYNISAPSPTTYPNNTFNLSEFSIVANTGTGGTTAFVDISNVDSIGVPITLQINPAGAAPTNLGVGIQLSFGGVQNQYKTFLTNKAISSPGAADFQQLVTPAMIVAPQHVIDSTSTAGPKLGLGPTTGGTLLPQTPYWYVVTSIVNGEESVAGGALSATTGTQVSNNLSNLLAWGKVANATSYNVYRAIGTSASTQPPNTDFLLLSSVQAPSTAFLDDGGYVTSQINPPTQIATAPNLQSATATWVPGGELPSTPATNVTYYYQLTALTSSGESSPSNTLSAAVQYDQNAVQLTWQAYANALGYNVYRSTTSPTSGFTYLGNVPASSTSYVDAVGAMPPQSRPTAPESAPTLNLIPATSGLTAGVTYYYQYTAINSSGIESLPSPAASKTATTGNLGISVSWTGSAASYNLYRAESSSGPFYYLANVGATSYGDVNNPPPSTTVTAPTNPATAPQSAPSLVPTAGGELQNGGTYYYQFTAITSTGESLPSSPAQVTLSAGNNSVTLSWAAYPNALGYKVYRSSSAGGQFLQLTTISGAATSYSDNGTLNVGGTEPGQRPTGPSLLDPAPVADQTSKLTANTWYYYQITAKSAAGETMASNFIGAQIPAGGSTSFYLSWPAFPNAVSYNIYRFASPSSTTAPGPFTLYDSSSTTSYTDSGNGTTSSTAPPVNSYTYNPLSSYFTDDLVAFFENYATTPNSFQLLRDGYTYTGQTTIFRDRGSDSKEHDYVVFQLSTTGVNSNPAYTVLAFKLNLYAPFFTDNYTGANPFGNSSTLFLKSYTIPPKPQWMTDGGQMPGSMVFGGSGVFNTGTDDPNSTKLGAPSGYIVPGTSINVLSDVQNSIDSAFNRGIAVTIPGGQTAIPPNNWAALPYALSATATTATGGVLTAPTNQNNAYFYLITAVNGLGEAPASNLVGGVWVAGSNAMSITWNPPSPQDAVVAPTGYNVYRSNSQHGPWTRVNANPLSPTNGINSYTDLGGGSAATPPTFYPVGSNSNYYAAFLHTSSTLLPGNPTNGASINGLAYGFAYDDQGGQSSTISVNDLQSIQINFQSNTGARAPHLFLSEPSITPNTAALAANAATLTIQGSGFDYLSPNLNVVSLSSGSGHVIAATETTLTVMLDQPPTAGALTALVNVNGLFTNEAQVATVFPVISPSTQSLNPNATTLIINGFGFDTSNPTNPGVNNRIFLSAGSGIVTSATSTQLTVTLGGQPLPQGVLNATISVNGDTNGGWVQVANIAGVAANIAVTGGTSPQSAAIGTAYGEPFQALVTDSLGIPVPGVTVMFVAPGSGASGMFAGGTATATAITDANGIATAPVFTANSIEGGPYSVVASVAGVTTQATFQLTNTANAAAAQTVGSFDPTTATWYLRNSNSAGNPSFPTFQYGAPGWLPVVGDWNGDGTTTVGVVEPTTMTWYLTNSNSAGQPSYTPFQYGAPGWIPVVGDWNGDGSTSIGVYDPFNAVWYLRNELSAGGPDAGNFQYGGFGWTPVTGDWDGNGTTTIGVVDLTMNWYLRNSNSPGNPDVPVFQYGGIGWTPVTGDWTGQGFTTVGVVDFSRNWYLSNSNSAGNPGIPVFQYGGSNWAALDGNWGSGSQTQLADGFLSASIAPQTALTDAQLAATVQGAVAKLSNAGIDANVITQLRSVQFSIGQLANGVLAQSDATTRQIVVDSDAAGYGWFVDATPGQDEEFESVDGTLHARPDSSAANRMDLLTVLLHELGHIHGSTDLDPTADADALMALTLSTGVRRTQALDSVFAHSQTIRMGGGDLPG